MASGAGIRTGSKRPRNDNVRPSVIGSPEDPWSYHKETVPADVPVRLLPQFVQLTSSEDPKDQLQGALLIRMLVSVSPYPPIDQVVKSQVVTRLISFMLRDDFVDLQLESARSVVIVASGARAHTHYVVKQGAVSYFIRLLNSPLMATREQATWALRNIAADSAACRDYVLSQGVMAPLLQCITTSAANLSVLRNGVWAVSNLCRSKPSPDLDTVCQALPVVVPLLSHDDEEIVTDACWVLAYISDGPPARVERVLDTGILPQVTALLSSVHASQWTPAARVVGNVAAGNEEQRRVLVSGGALSNLHIPLQHPRRSIRHEALRALRGITSGPPEHIQAVIEEGLFLAVIRCISACREHEIKTEAVRCVANISTGGTPEQIRYIVEEHNVLDNLGPVLVQTDSSDLLEIALDAIWHFLEEGADVTQRRGLAENPYVRSFIATGGLPRLETLTGRADSDVTSDAGDIINTFFKCPEAQRQL